MNAAELRASFAWKGPHPPVAGWDLAMLLRLDDRLLTELHRLVVAAIRAGQDPMDVQLPDGIARHQLGLMAKAVAAPACSRGRRIGGSPQNPQQAWRGRSSTGSWSKPRRGARSSRSLAGR